jgi:predicted RNA-binding Zn-ribbon protein involved in translation (DUF1610 family)
MVWLLTHLSFPLFAALLGACLFWIGWHGWRVDEHPLCRRCHFDLFGLPNTSNHCPECGNDLRRKRSQRVGHRVWRPLPAIFGCLFLVPSLAWLSAITWVRVRHIRPLDWEPTALLMREVHSGNPTARQVALAELFRRLPKLSREQISRIADDALAQQANEQTIWQPEWGDFLELAHQQRQLSSTQWGKYLTQAVKFQIKTRKTVFADDPLHCSSCRQHLDLAELRA